MLAALPTLARRFAVSLVLATTTFPAQSQPDRPQFEVASVRPSTNEEMGGGQPSQTVRELMRQHSRPVEISMTESGRVRLQNWALIDLIAAAYSVRASQVSGPAWISDRGFDIEAKVPEGTPKKELNAMLQSLLEERFGLKVHRSSQTGPGFALTVGKGGPKLIPARPPAASAEDLTEEEQKAQIQQKMKANLTAQMKYDQEKLAAVGPFNNIGWPSITMEELAAHLALFAEAPVIDLTHLTGEYKVTIDTWSNPDVPGGTVFDAVEKLGLRLEPRKVTVETVVVDQVFKAPTAN